MSWLNTILILILVVLAYVFWVRPILKTQPSLKEFYDAEGSLWEAFKSKTSGIRQKLAGATIAIAIGVVQVYDKILPALTGVDTTKLTAMMPIPDWAWPWLAVAAVLLLNYFRKLADQRHEEVVTRLADDSAVTMKAASLVVQQSTGNDANEAVQSIVDAKKDIVAADVTQTQPM